MQDQLLKVLNQVVQAESKVPADYYDQINKIYTCMHNILTNADNCVNALNDFEDLLIPLIKKEGEVTSEHKTSDSSIRYLIQALFQMFGNKRYLHDLEKLLKAKLDNLDPQENQILLHLIRDLRDFSITALRHRKEAKERFNF